MESGDGALGSGVVSAGMEAMKAGVEESLSTLRLTAAGEVCSEMAAVEAIMEEEEGVSEEAPVPVPLETVIGVVEEDPDEADGDDGPILIPMDGSDDAVPEDPSEPSPEMYSDPAVLVPRVGQLFKEEVDGYAFFNLYARFNGFGIRRSKYRTSKKKDGLKTMQEFCCIRQGRNPRATGPNPTRIGCRAMIRICRPSEKHDWKVTAFVSTHNHGMKREFSHTRNYRSHNQIDEGTKGIVTEMVDKGIPPTNMYGLVAGMHGGPSLSPFTRKAMSRLVYSIRRDECSDDVQKTMDFFRELQLQSSDFFHTVQVDRASRLKNIFWAHSSSRLSFEHFGDVVTFDTTYRTNRYNMPFGIFVGVNNHFQTVVFGCALLREETVEAFKWLFRTFTRAMNGKKPNSILTDNCHQMEVAIQEVWPEATHRVCKWHVLKKAKENLGNIYSRKRSNFKDEFHSAINEPHTPDEFERAWKAVVDRYDLGLNVYLKRMWDMKEKWAPAYFREHFFAKMSTTQRSESMNHVFKKYVKASSSINGFARRYESFYYDRLQAEDTEDFHCFNEKVSFTTDAPMEKHAASVYTRGAFSKFKEQLLASFSYKVEATDKEDELLVLHIGDTPPTWGRKVYEVHANVGELEFSCACKLFEHLGILCCHILMVMVQQGIKGIPEKYILKRWTKDARSSIPEHLAGYMKDKEAAQSRSYRHALLHKSALDLVRLGDTNVEAYHKTMEVLCKLMVDLRVLTRATSSNQNESRKTERVVGKKPINVEVETSDDDDTGVCADEDDETISLEDEDVEDLEEMEIHPPEVRRSRGRPKTKRFMSGGERASVVKKKSAAKVSAGGSREMQIRYCKSCGKTGHNSATCGRESSYKRKS